MRGAFSAVTCHTPLYGEKDDGKVPANAFESVRECRAYSMHDAASRTEHPLERDMDP
jgi:hypothetical protein